MPLARMRALLPGAVQMVYDNYNALAIGFGPTERPSEAPFSIAAFPRRPSLCFLIHGAELTDPEGLLKGKGNQVRSIPVSDVATLDAPAVRALIDEALSRAGWQPKPGSPGRLIIKSISAKQRPRRPTGE